MTWGEFKATMDAHPDVTDETEISYIDTDCDQPLKIETSGDLAGKPWVWVE